MAKNCKDSQNKYKVEDIDLGDSDTSSSSDSDDSLITVSARRRGKYKDVVTPPKYSIDSTQNLKKYLDIYERYFSVKFEGGERECAMELGRFLTGEIRDLSGIGWTREKILCD